MRGGARATTGALSAVSISIQRRFGRQRLRKILLGSIPFLVMIGVWHANTVFEWLPPVFIPFNWRRLGSIFFLAGGLRGLRAIDNA